MSMPQTAASFWARVDKSAGPTACWPWRGLRKRHGYGTVKWCGKSALAHRLALTLTVGHEPTPEKPCVLHRCDNPPCCNPAHLFAGTQAENIRDRHAKGRSGAPRGERHGAAKLTEADVLNIRRRYLAGGVLQRELAAEYGVGQTSISAALHGVKWKHLGVRP